MTVPESGETESVMVDGVALLHQIERFLNEDVDAEAEDRNTGIEAYQACSGAVFSAVRRVMGNDRVVAIFKTLPKRPS